MAEGVVEQAAPVQEAQDTTETPKKSKVGSIKKTLLRPFKGLRVGKKVPKDASTDDAPATNGTADTNGHDQTNGTNGTNGTNDDSDQPPANKPDPPPESNSEQPEAPIPAADE